ncbi:hypothetical protein AB0N09_35675 [Streptomyces erythrochromogenes]|uniref:hypothetical protein n=1 Tax=Streptomyces erythrochromogenes TaxID=285574 RepID=UPI003442B905
MPRKITTAARRARSVQEQSGGKYTPLLRAGGHGPSGLGPTAASPTEHGGFPLRALIAECATLPPSLPDWGWHPDAIEQCAPKTFESQLLGTHIPFGTVMALAGELAQRGHADPVTVESVSPLEDAVVRCAHRRFQLHLSQDGLYELCRTPACTGYPVHATIHHCADHLADCSTSQLKAMATDWGYARKQEMEHDPARIGGSTDADHLVRAAAANGAYAAVATALLHAAFEDPGIIDDVPWNNPTGAVDMLHGMEHERIRLARIAITEVRRLRAAAGLCTACGKPLPSYGPLLEIPIGCCSTACTPSRPTAQPPYDPWAAGRSH